MATRTLSESPKITASGWVTKLTWGQADILVTDLEGKEQSYVYDMEPWEWYAAQVTPTFDIVESKVTANDVDPEVAQGYNLATPENPDGVPELIFPSVVWHADFKEYAKYVPGEYEAFDVDITNLDDEMTPEEEAEYLAWSLEQSTAAHKPNTVLDAEGVCADLKCEFCYEQE